MGKQSKRNKRQKQKTKRTRSSSSCGSSSSSARTPSPPPKHRKQVSRKADTSTVSTNNTLNNIIPEFDPLRDDVNAWLSIIRSYAHTFSWTDEITRYQALNKLKGSAKVWYDSLLRSDNHWPMWKWKDWTRKLASSFQIRRNMFDLLKDIINEKPSENQSLYEFYFEQKCKIDRLSLEFSEQDIISIIVGNIGDSGIGASIEANNFVTCDSLASFLHGRTYTSKSARQIGANTRYSHTKSISQNQMSATTTSATVPSANVVGQAASVSNSQDVSQAHGRRQIECFLCGGNHKRHQCDANKCDYCGKRGHLESTCYHKKNAVKPEKQETKCITTPDPRNDN